MRYPGSGYCVKLLKILLNYQNTKMPHGLAHGPFSALFDASMRFAHQTARNLFSRCPSLAGQQDKPEILNGGTAGVQAYALLTVWTFPMSIPAELRGLQALSPSSMCLLGFHEARCSPPSFPILCSSSALPLLRSLSYHPPPFPPFPPLPNFILPFPPISLVVY